MDADKLLDALKEAIGQAKPERKQATEEQIKQTNDVLDEAITRMRRSVYGSYLLDKYPLRRTSEREYPEANAVLREVGSPAMTDGKNVYVDAKILADMLVQDYPMLKKKSDICYPEEWWTKTELDNTRTIGLTSGWADSLGSDAISEVQDIIYHELTHALNEHSRVSATMEARGASPETMAKLAIACELQANDGVAGRSYARNVLQRQNGVTNKRLHPETYGCHTLREFMDKIELNEQEKKQAQTKATAQAMNNTVRMAKATGEYKKQLEQAKAEQAKEGDGEKKPGYGKPTVLDADLDNQSATAKINQEMERAGVAAIKKLLLEALSDQLRYDPATDSVFFDETIRRVARRTYARPSRKMTAGNPIIKKGVVYDRVHEPNKANKLTVLAVDASGSMRNQQGYVAALLDDLLQQAEKIAREHKLEVHYENLMCTLHRTRATKLVPATSSEWAQAMRDYHANGGNNFDCVMEAVQPAVRKRSYDAVTIINLSDGFDYLNEPYNWCVELRDYMSQNKLSWVDALIAYNSDYIEEASRYRAGDDVAIRKQVVLNIQNKCD